MLSACATERRGAVPRAPSAATAGQIAADTRALVARPVEPGLWRYRVIDSKNPVFYLTHAQSDPCYSQKSRLPADGAVPEDIYVLARKRDIKMFDLCIRRFNTLRGLAFRMMEAVREW